MQENQAHQESVDLSTYGAILSTQRQQLPHPLSSFQYQPEIQSIPYDLFLKNDDLPGNPENDRFSGIITMVLEPLEGLEEYIAHKFHYMGGRLLEVWFEVLWHDPAPTNIAHETKSYGKWHSPHGRGLWRGFPNIEGKI